MLFHSSLRKELARSFGATLVILFVIVLTMLLIRTLGLAARGSVDPQELMLVLGYTMLGQLPVLLTLALFAAIVATLSRLYANSEMVIWHASGQGLYAFLRPVLQFAWPVLLAIALLILLMWPWANNESQTLRTRFEQRSDLARVAPGQFQESANGQRVFFIDKDGADSRNGRNVFISSKLANGNEVITTAQSGRVEVQQGQQFLLLTNGQNLERSANNEQLRISEFKTYGIQVGDKAATQEGSGGPRRLPTLTLLTSPDPSLRGELGWRLGMVLSSINLVLIALAATSANPRTGRGGNLAFTLFTFMFYNNLVNLGQRWVTTERIGLPALLLLLHGTVFVAATLWLLKRHLNWQWPRPWAWRQA